MEREKHKEAWKQGTAGRDRGISWGGSQEHGEFGVPYNHTERKPRGNNGFGLAPDPLTLDSQKVKTVVFF